MFDQFETIFKKLLNDPNYTVTNVYHTFDPEDIIFTGDDQFNRLGKKTFDASTDPNRFDQGNSVKWIVPLKKLDIDTGLDTNVYQDVFPIRIKDAVGNDLVINSDFQVVNKNVLFNMDPRDLFKDNKFLITYGVRVSKNIYSFPVGLETSGSINAVQKFAKISQSPENFKLALAEICNLKVLKETQRLIHIGGDNDSIIYTFEKEIIKIDYPHEKLTLNKIYPKHTVVGEGIELYTPRPGAWWKEINFRGGISLSPIVGRPGILLPEGKVLAYAANAQEGSMEGSKVNIRLDLPGNPDDVDSYWESVEQREIENDIYLNSIVKLGLGDATFIDSKYQGIFSRLLDLTKSINDRNVELGIYKKEYRNIKRLKDNAIIDPSDPLTEHTKGLKTVNAFDVFFEGILAQTACVIILDKKQVGTNMKVVTDFINKEQPVGMSCILIIRYEDMSDTESVNTLISDSVVTNVTEQSSEISNTSLNSIIVDSFVTRIDT
tara:strand:- start:1114 stop:2586 length:1473 start_codon:yes stop_codon:yes gene_type:complete